MTNSPNEYSVATLWDMARIPIEARERFLAELPEMLQVIADMQEQAIPLTSAVWTDNERFERTIIVNHPDGTITSDTAEFTPKT